MMFIAEIENIDNCWRLRVARVPFWACFSAGSWLVGGVAPPVCFGHHATLFGTTGQFPKYDRAASIVVDSVVIKKQYNIYLSNASMPNSCGEWYKFVSV
jgi:hypothetical protein